MASAARPAAPSPPASWRAGARRRRTLGTRPPRLDACGCARAVLAEASVLLAGIAGLDGGRFTALTFLANLGVSAAHALAGATASWTARCCRRLPGNVLPALVIGAASLARRQSRGRGEPTQA